MESSKARGYLPLYHYANIALRGTLGDGPHIDACPPESPKEGATYAGTPDMFFPTAAKIANPSSAHTMNLMALISEAKVLLATAVAKADCSAGTAKQIEYSLEAWLIKITEIPASCIAPKRRWLFQELQSYRPLQH